MYKITFFIIVLFIGCKFWIKIFAIIIIKLVSLNLKETLIVIVNWKEEIFYERNMVKHKGKLFDLLLVLGSVVQAFNSEILLYHMGCNAWETLNRG